MSVLSNSLIESLNAQKIPFEIIEHDEITCVDDGVKLLHFPENQILKTIGFIANEHFIFVALQGRKRVDYKKLVQALGFKREILKMLPIEIVEVELGYQAGGLSPLHVDPRISVFIDSEVLRLDTVFCGIGVRNKTLKISPSNLIMASEAVAIELAK